MRPTVHVVPWEPGVEYSLVPAACTHFPIGDRELLAKWVKRINDDPFAFTVLDGDQFDFCRTTYGRYLGAYQSDTNSQQAIDEMHKRDVREFAEILMPIREKIVGVVSGNHKFKFVDGIYNDQYLCQLINRPYLGVFSLFRAEFREITKKYNKTSDGGQLRYSMPVLAHHSGGCKGSRTQGGDTTALRRTEEGFEAQIYIAAHTHRKHSFKVPKVGIPLTGEPLPREYTKVFIRAGAFLKGYEADYPSATQPHIPSYAEEAMYPPVDLGYVTCAFKFKSIRNHETDTKVGYVPEFELRF